MGKKVTPEILEMIFEHFRDGVHDAPDVDNALNLYGFSRDQRESIVAVWENAIQVAKRDQTAREVNADLYERIEAMARANPIIQTLKSISVKLENLTNQADRLDALLIPFAGPYPDIPTLLFLENLCSAIDDLPLCFVQHFSTELDMLRVHSKTTQVWLEALEQDYADKDFDAEATLHHELHEADDVRGTAGEKLYWACSWCQKTNHDTDTCECGQSAPWIAPKRTADDDDKQPF